MALDGSNPRWVTWAAQPQLPLKVVYPMPPKQGCEVGDLVLHDVRPWLMGVLLGLFPEESVLE